MIHIRRSDRTRDPKEMAGEHLELGTFYFLSQRYKEAIGQFKKALVLERDNADAYFNLGIAYEAINQIAQAKQNFQKALDLRPAMKSAQEHLDRLVGV
jgi:tetratricopeptide (TPR) repeat protein